MNQLFKTIPPLEVIDEVLCMFGVVNFNENYKFTRDDIKYKGIIEKLLNFGLDQYYINCKYQKYFSDLNEKKVITILRQLVRPHGYKINSIEKFSNGRKYLIYHLTKNTPPVTNKNTILKFD